ncbi:MAG: ABC transporter ATP-binding protein [Bacteroidota bacterium]
MIRTQNLRKVYRTDEIETTSLAGINLEIASGEFVAIMGPSGCGKSTLLNVIGLLDTASTGEYWFMGQETGKLNEKRKAEMRKSNIGFIFQSFNLIDELTVRENIELPLLYLGLSSAERRQRVDKVLEDTGIAHRAKHFPQQLSGGQQQRVAVCRALVIRPTLILADEPTGNLDSKNGEEVMRLLTDLHETGTTVLMVTHSPEHARYAHRTVHLFDGQVVSENYKPVATAV